MKYYLLVSLLVVSVLSEGLDISSLTSNGKKFFTDMSKQALGLPSLKPENVAAQQFFRNFCNKYTNLDENTKKSLEQHIPKATKIFKQAAAKLNIDPAQAFSMLSTFFETFKKQSQGAMAKKGFEFAKNLFNKNTF